MTAPERVAFKTEERLKARTLAYCVARYSQLFPNHSLTASGKPPSAVEIEAAEVLSAFHSSLVGLKTFVGTYPEPGGSRSREVHEVWERMPSELWEYAYYALPELILTQGHTKTTRRSIIVAHDRFTRTPMPEPQRVTRLAIAAIANGLWPTAVAKRLKTKGHLTIGDVIEAERENIRVELKRLRTHLSTP